MKINNRRYIGCKQKLLQNIYNTVANLGFNNEYSFADIFAGTGVVGAFFADKGYKVLLNDSLYSNYVSYQAWIGNGTLDEQKVKNIVKFFNSIDSKSLPDNYFSKVYGGKYFSINNSKLIGFARDWVENHKNELSDKEYYYLITVIMYSADKIANTVGHYESYIKKEIKETKLVFGELDILHINNEVELFNRDANELASEIEYDVVYLDPPYNARQYVNFYHVLENLARWNKPTIFEGDSMKFQRNELKSGYCRGKAKQLMADLVDKLKCKVIIVSYNNTYSANSISSNNTISELEMLNILQRKGEVERIEIDYRFFNTGKTEFKNHKEFLYICKVGR